MADGRALILAPEDEKEAERRRQLHMEQDEIKGQIEAFLARPVPEDWMKWDETRRMMFWSGQCKGDGLQLVPRDRVCALEIMRECLGDRRSVIPQKDSRRVNAVLMQLKGWEASGIMRFGAKYGRQRGFKKCQQMKC